MEVLDIPALFKILGRRLGTVFFLSFFLFFSISEFFLISFLRYDRNGVGKIFSESSMLFKFRLHYLLIAHGFCVSTNGRSHISFGSSY